MCYGTPFTVENGDLKQLPNINNYFPHRDIHDF